jgi:hypothetical protein
VLNEFQFAVEQRVRTFTLFQLLIGTGHCDALITARSAAQRKKIFICMVRADGRKFPNYLKMV